MPRLPSAVILALAAGVGLWAPAQEAVHVHAVLEAWYTQMLSDNLRLDAAPAAAPYYASGALNPAFREDTFTLRRTNLYLDGRVGDQVAWGVMLDPNTSSNSQPAATSSLQDAWMAYAWTPRITVKMGQFKMPMNFESTLLGASKLLFYDRAMTARMWAEKRDRGVLATWRVGDPRGLSAKLSLGLGNGMTDSTLTYKANDTNAQKDVDLAVNAAFGEAHRFGGWYRAGETDVRDVGLVAGTFPGPGAPNAAAVLANEDRTTNLGAYYLYDDSRWQGAVEVSTGLLGRRYPSVFPAGTAPPAKALRQHLDQRYLGYTLSGALKLGRHWLTARYDALDFNQGNAWYTASDPYTTDVATGAPTGSDFTPRYYEAILGYNYLFNPARYADGKIKLDFIHRGRNFLAPRAGQTGAQGGDSLVLSVMVGF